MDYERIDRPLGGGGGGGFSPKKLRSMLMGVEKKRKDGDELGSKFNLRSHGSEIDESGGMSSDSCKDVDVVSVLPDCSTSTRADSLAFEMGADRRFKDHPSVNSRVRSMDDPSLDYDSSHDGIGMSVSPSVFEFQKTERAHQRVPVAPFSKPAPSKWDDAQKWIASPTSNRPKAGQGQVHGGQGAGSRKGIGYFRQSSTKVVVEVPDSKGVASEEPDTKRIDTNHAKKENGGQKFVSWEADPYPIADSYGKSVAMIESSLGESEVNLSRHDSGVAIHSATTFIPSPTARSVSMRDMGTDMTPIASQEPSRNGTPVRATTPMRSPDSSRPTTPGRRARASATTDLPNDHLVSNNDLSEKELQMKTRREIIALGTQLGKMNIAAWASKEEEDKDASASLKNIAAEQQPKSATELRAAAWEEAEKAKYIARFKREEMKIQAWENHQKAKAEAEMKKIEVEVERMQGRAHDKLMNKLAATRIKAEEKLAAAEAKRNQEAARTDKQRDRIRKTGRISSSFSFCGWCS